MHIITIDLKIKVIIIPTLKKDDPEVKTTYFLLKKTTFLIVFFPIVYI